MRSRTPGIARATLALALLAAAGGCGGSSGAGGSPTGPPGTGALTLAVVARGLDAPLYVTAPRGDSRLFIVEQPGRIRVVKDGALLATPFLDITSLVTYGGEQGLLSMAFHPHYADNGFVYVDYTDAFGDTRVVRYHAAPGADVADVASATNIFGMNQPYANHNGGLIAFGPDGMLYVALGDGGSAGDPQGNAQNLSSALGKILRIDVDHGSPYAIPPDNPYAGVDGVRPEIWASGLRNPWRFSFDTVAGLLYIGDVGQSAWEEVDVAPAGAGGLNYGWNIMEGAHCYGAAACDTTGLTPPVLEYSHNDGCAITGGYVYRGDRIPALAGAYVYADYCNGWIRSFHYDAGQVTDEQDWALGDIGRITSFGQDAAGELYVTSSNGTVYRLDPGTG